MMKRALVFVLLVAAGFLAFSVYSVYVDESSMEEQAGLSVVEPENQEDESETPADENLPVPTTLELAEEILPQRAPAWLWADLEEWNEHSAEMREWLSEPAVEPIWNQASAGFPDDISATISTFADAQTLRFFLLPTAEQNKRSWVSVFSSSSIPMDEALAALTPSSGTSTVLEAGPYSLSAIDSPDRNLVLLEEEAMFWVSNSPEAFIALLTRPTANGAGSETSLQQTLHSRYPDAVAMLHVNSGGNQAAETGSPIWLNGLMAAGGLTHLAAVLHCPDNRGRLSIMAESAETPAWVQDWLPLKEPLFTPDDPPGMLEFGMRWLRYGEDGIISRIPETDSPDESDAAPQDVEANTNEIQAQTPDLQRSPKARQRVRRGGFFSIANMIPPGQPVALNLFTTTENLSAVAIRLPDFILEDSFIGRLKQMPFLQTETIELDRIPGYAFTLKGTPLAEGMGLDELVAIERDGNVYLFDSRVAATMYFERPDPEAQNRIEAPYETTPAQIRGIITPEMLNTILDIEMNRLEEGHPAREEFVQMKATLEPKLKPVALQGGIQDNEWFLEFDSETEFGITAGTGLAAWGLWMWLNP